MVLGEWWVSNAGYGVTLVLGALLFGGFAICGALHRLGWPLARLLGSFSWLIPSRGVGVWARGVFLGVEV